MIRVVQFIVTPMLVEDDGETLTPLQVAPITVSAAEWPQFSAEIWPVLLAEQQRATQ
jgi:hypothetical protein